jgi:release factor glutamine methyltransferase
LRAAGDAEADAAADRILFHLLGLDRAHFYRERDRPLIPAAQAMLTRLLERRLRGEPVAYLTGRAPFRTLELEVTPAVLVPRPETELLVEQALTLLRAAAAPRVVDVGTGCGAIALALAAECPQAEVLATERSWAALAVARRNRDRLGLPVTLIAADLLGPLRGPFDLVIANLPYLDPETYARLPKEVRQWEPPGALLGGPGGLAVIERLLAQVGDRLARPGAVVLEIAYDQGARACQLARQYFPTATVSLLRDYAGHERVVQILVP